MKSNLATHSKVTVLTLLLGIFISEAQASPVWPISYTSEIWIELLDAQTRSPISGAVVEVVWRKRFPRTFFESAGKEFRKDYFISDMEGTVFVPSNLDYHILSRFSEQLIYIRHPMYEFIEFVPSAVHLKEKNIFRLGNKIRIRINSLKSIYMDVECLAQKGSDGRIDYSCNKNVAFSEPIRQASIYFKILQENKRLSFDGEILCKETDFLDLWKIIEKESFRKSSYKPTWLSQ